MNFLSGLVRSPRKAALGIALAFAVQPGLVAAQMPSLSSPPDTMGWSQNDGLPAAARSATMGPGATTPGAAVPQIRSVGGMVRSGGAANERDVPADVRLRSVSAPDASILPPPPNEFQRFILNATGQELPVFGYRFFQNPLDTFAPLDGVPVPADYVVGPGDEVTIRAWGSVDMDVRAVVDRNGRISIPRVGTVEVARLKTMELEPALRAAIGRVFRGFTLSVSLGQLRSIQVFVVGQAQRPGTYTVGSLSTFVNAVFASGGPGPNGSMRSVRLQRGGSVVAELDLYDFIVHGRRPQDQRLLPGDVIVYPPAGPRVAVMGAVDTAAVFELKPQGTPLMEVLDLAGGRRAHLNPRQALLERLDDTNVKRPRQVVQVDLTATQQPMLRDGDLLTILPAEPGFSNAITLRGHVAQPLRYAHTPGIRISQIIPERDALITRDYHLRKNRLVQFVREEDTSRSGVASALMLPSEARSRLDPRAGLDARPVNDSRIGSEWRPGMDPRLGMDGRSPTDSRSTWEGTSAAAAAGASPRGATQGAGLSAAQDAFRALAEEPNWEYATVERLDAQRLTTVLLPFHLGKAVLERDPVHDLVLEPGDIITIYSSKDIRSPRARLTQIVRVEGEVDRPGVYQLRPGETLHALIERAGGVTPQAYLFGTEFTRESTRQKQRLALQDTLRRLEASLATAGAQKVANLASTSDAAAAARLQASEEQARRAQLERLRGIQPNGRIALELGTTVTQVRELPDIPLEDGDAVFVPTRPGFVFAVGAVANENALLWRSGRTVRDYLRTAGVLPDADEANFFVVRADGSVRHQRGGRGSFFARNAIESMELAPGDTIVVPDRVDREGAWSAFVRGAKDWTQILANFGIAAAAIKTLRD